MKYTFYQWLMVIMFFIVIILGAVIDGIKQDCKDVVVVLMVAFLITKHIDERIKNTSPNDKE